MSCRYFAAVIAIVLLAPVPMPGQAAKRYTPPKTPWGDPDLQGLWPGTVTIPLQRPVNMGERATLTEEEFAERENQAKTRAARGARNWIEYFPAGRQASLIVDPPNGRIPPLTPEAEKRIKGMRDGLGPPSLGGVEKRADSWEDFDLWGRCITRGLVGSMVPGGLYNKGNQIVQAPGYVAIRNEMVHETRVIPLDGRPHVGKDIHMYLGDGRGHWEGNTLVVETTNFKDNTSINAFDGSSGPHTAGLRLVERIARVSPEEISYDVTIEDLKTWTRPWTIHIPYKLDPSYTIYEYACHEANYGLADILKGARVQEKIQR